MANLPNSLKSIAYFLERLPGIGEKTANRLAFYLLRMPDTDLKEFSQNVANLKAKTKLCEICLNLTEENLCDVCQDNKRDYTTVTVVEGPLDVLSLETGNIYQGIYHVLHGRIDPLNNVGPDEIYIDKLVKRIVDKKNNGGVTVREVVLATNPDMEGEATAMFIRKRLSEFTTDKKTAIKLTRLAYGLPMGANLEYADYGTLKKALDNRNAY